jgi:hypothetical protein
MQPDPRKPTSPDAAQKLAAANRRTALILASIAVVFFFGVFGARLLGSPTASIAVLGGAVFLFLLLAIGRHLRR